MRFRRSCICLLLAAAIYASCAGQNPAAQQTPAKAIHASGIYIPVSRGTFPTAINKSGEIAGYCVDSIAVAHGFVRDSRGKITVFDAPRAGAEQRQGTFARDMNDDGTTVGYYIDSDKVHHGFLRDLYGDITTLDAPGARTALQPPVIGHPELLSGQGTIATSVNDAGTTTGYFFDGKNVQHGFVRDKLGAFIVFDFPGSGGTIPESINALGQITGTFDDPPEVTATPTMHSYRSGAVHCFVRESDGRMAMCDIPGENKGPTEGPRPETISGNGTIFGSDERGGGFIRDIEGQYTRFRVAAVSHEPPSSAEDESPSACYVEANASLQLEASMSDATTTGTNLAILVPGRYRGDICEKVVGDVMLTGSRSGRGKSICSGSIRDEHGHLTLFDVACEASAVTITSVTPIVNGVTKALTIKGRHFGTHQAPTSELGGLVVLSETGSFNCGDAVTLGNREKDQLRVIRWTDTEIDIVGFSWPSNSICQYLPGDRVNIGVWNPETGAGPANYELTIGTTSKDTTPPEIISVSPVYPRGDQAFVIKDEKYELTSAEILRWRMQALA